MPVTKPTGDTEALLLLLLQTPVAPDVSAIPDPAHTLEAPVIAGTTGSALIVSIAVTDVKQPARLVTV